MGLFPFRRRVRRRRSPFNNLGPNGLTCGRVTDFLYVGGELGPNDWHALRQAGVTMAVNLQQEQQDLFNDDEQVDGYLWLPSLDGLAPSLEQLAMGVDFIHAAVKANRGVLVHCKAGQGRAPLLCACYLISEGATPLAATSKVREARPQTMLTPEQNVRLREFAEAYGVPAEPHGTAPDAAAPHDVVSPASANGSSNGTARKASHPVATPKPSANR